MTETRYYFLKFELGARGVQFNTLEDARRHIHSRRTADLQAVGIGVSIYRDGRYWGDGELTAEEKETLGRPSPVTHPTNSKQTS